MSRTRFSYAFSTASGFELIELFHFVFDVLAYLGVQICFDVFTGGPGGSKFSLRSPGAMVSGGRSGDVYGFSIVEVLEVGVVGVVLAAGSLAHFLTQTN